MLPEQRLHPGIKRCVEEVNKAIEELIKFTAVVQGECDHARVAELPWGEHNRPTRICLCCGLEEVGSYWSGGSIWNRGNYQPALLGNQSGRDVLPFEDRWKFWDLRVPYVPRGDIGEEK